MLTLGEKQALNLDVMVDALRKDINKVKGKYKIEVHFGKDRSISNLKHSVGLVTIWESGKRFHGGGDEKMYWCGYKDCEMPIKVENFGFFHVVCPSCSREVFLDPDSQAQHIAQVKRDRKDTRPFKAMPIVVGEKLFRLAPPKLAALLEKLFRQLDGDADVYLKYHPSDIRYDMVHDNAKAPGILEKARADRYDKAKGAPLIYPLARILKDTSAGADIKKRFLALVTA